MFTLKFRFKKKSSLSSEEIKAQRVQVWVGRAYLGEVDFKCFGEIAKICVVLNPFHHKRLIKESLGSGTS